MSQSNSFELLLTQLIQLAGSRDFADISEEQAICFLQDELNLDRVAAISEFQSLIQRFRRKQTVRHGKLIQWQMFRCGFHICRLPTPEDVQNTAEIYQSTTDDEIARRIRALKGVAFERFLTTVLSKCPDYRNISVTQATRDGGVDFRGLYVRPGFPDSAALIGQAKQASSPVSASVARDFIGALDISQERRPLGLFVSTAGFTEPAARAIDRSRFHIIRWDMSDLLQISHGIATRRINVSFEVPDQTFWEEVGV